MLTGVSAYSDDEVREILHRAVVNSTDSNLGLSHQELAEVAAEVGIAPADLERAAAQVRLERTQRTEEEEARAAFAIQKKRRRRGFFRHFFTYGVVTSGLYLLDSLSPGSSWWIYPAIGWGIAVGLNAASVLFADDDAALERERKRIRRKRQRENQRAQQKKGKQASRKALVHAEASFEAAVERGVTLLLEKAAQKMEKAVHKKELQDTEFGRYVATKEGTPVRVQSSSEVKARVASIADELPDEQEEDIDSRRTNEAGRETKLRDD